MEVTQEDCGLRACDDQDEENQKQESEHVIHLVGPNRIQNEEQLDENATEGQNTSHDDSWNWLCVDRLVWYLSWNLIRSDWVLHGLKGKIFLFYLTFLFAILRRE